MDTYARSDVAFAKGEGAYLFDVTGKRYLDFGSGIAVTALGHCHPHLVAALKAQADQLWHCSNLYQIPEQERLARRLTENTFADKVFFANSGAEAVECGLKLVRKFMDDKGDQGRYRVITCTDGFHGRTLATIAAGGTEKHLAGFAPVMNGFDHVPFGNLNEMRAAITEQTAAILVEPVQGEGGIRPGAADYLRGLRATADEFGVLLFFDEVQTGMGRTGKLFACEWAGVAPDVLAVAKGLGGGFPVGACLVSARAAALSPGSHGSTFGGNPLAMAVGNAVLDVLLEPGFLDGVQQMGNKLLARARAVAAAYPKVLVEARGVGLMIGLKCAGDNLKFVAKAMEGGLLTVPAADSVARLLPPLIIDDGHVDEAIDILEATCRAIEAEGAG